MSILKDLLLITSLICLYIYCLNLNKKIRSQREFFINVFRHDIKVPLLAQKNALEFLASNQNKELAIELAKSCSQTLDMVNLLVNSNDTKYELAALSLESEIIRTFNVSSDSADKKNINFLYEIDENICLRTNPQTFRQFLSSMVLHLIGESKFHGNLGCFLSKSFLCTKIKFITTINPKPVQSANSSNFTPVGYEIEKAFRKKFICANKWKIYEHVDKYNVKTVTIIIPTRKFLPFLQTLFKTLIQECACRLNPHAL